MRIHPFITSMLVVAALGSVPVMADDSASSRSLPAGVRSQFLDDAEQKLRAAAPLTDDFYSWLDGRPQIRAGLLTVADPVPPEFAENLADLRSALGPDISEKYASLLLGASLGPRLGHVGVNNPQDGAYNASEQASAPNVDADPRIAKVADYLAQHDIKLIDFIPKADQILGELNLPPLKSRERDAFFNNLAFATHTYPPRLPLPLADCLRTIITHFQTTLPHFSDKGPQWPLFPLDKAPWPLLVPMRQTLPQRELDYLWDRFNGKFGAPRLPTYGHYSFDYQKPEIQFKTSDWNPAALPRIIEDGGVCGRLSTLAQLAKVGLGQPAVGMYQPGHRALISFNFDPQSHHYFANREQGITTPDRSTAAWYLPPPDGDRVTEHGRVVGIEYYVALALSMDIGLDAYTDSRIALLLARRISEDQPDQKRALLQTAADLNPYNLEAWYALARLSPRDTSAVNTLLYRLDTLLFSPDLSAAQEQELAANTDLSAHLVADQPKDLKRESKLIDDIVGTQILQSVYTAALKDTADLAAHRADLQAEIDRITKLNLPYQPAAQELLVRFNVAVDGPSSTEQSIAGRIQHIDPATKHLADAESAVESQVDAVLQSIPKSSDRIAWLKVLCDDFPQSARFKVAKNGDAKIEPLYNDLKQKLIRELNGSGRSGAAEGKRVAAQLESDRIAAGQHSP